MNIEVECLKCGAVGKFEIEKGNNDSDAVEFAEWTCHKGYIGYLNGDSYYWYDKSGEGIGTAYDLYKLFKQSKL